MTTYYNSYASIGELSRRKLQTVAESSDTLRRAVVIHNVMRSTASIQDQYSASSSSTSALSASYPPAQNSHYQHRTLDHYYDDDDELAVEEDEERYYREAAGTVRQRQGASVGDPADATYGADAHFVFPQMTSRVASFSGEQDWLDSILDDLQGDVHVVDAEADEDNASSSPDWHPPLFPSPQCAIVSANSPPSSPPLRPTSPRCTPIPEAFFDSSSDQEPCGCADSPPTSPPGLDADTIDSDDEDDDYGLMDSEDFSEVNTPSASTEFPRAQPDYVLFNHLPFNRLRPALCHPHQQF